MSVPRLFIDLPALPRRRRGSTRIDSPGLGLAVTVAAILLVFGQTPATAQIGAPIGAPTGVPHGLPSGAAGYNSNGGSPLAPPVSNWSAQDAGRGAFNSRITGTERRPLPASKATPEEVPLPPASRTRQSAPQAAGMARDPRAETGSVNHTANAGSVGSMGPGERLTATRKVAAVETNPVEALRDLVQKGQMHETGLGMPKNLVRAFDLYCEAGAAGYPDALLRMGWMFAEGNGVEKNQAAASTLFRRAARFGGSIGSELADRFPPGPELLPVCLKGTVVEKGTAERPATASELAAMAPKLDPSMMMLNPVVGAERAKLVKAVIAEARDFKLDPRLVLAVMATESAFDPNAKSPKNAQGLMQLIPETAARFNVGNILDPLENIRGGMSYLRWLLSYFRGDVTLTLAAYNAGEGAVDRHSGVPPYQETLAYVQKIRAIYPFDRHPYDATISNTVSRNAPQATRTVDAKSVVETGRALAKN